MPISAKRSKILDAMISHVLNPIILFYFRMSKWSPIYNWKCEYCFNTFYYIINTHVIQLRAVTEWYRLLCLFHAQLYSHYAQLYSHYAQLYSHYAQGFSRKKYLGGIGTPSIIWGTTTRILIIVGVPPYKYKYLKWPPPRK